MESALHPSFESGGKMYAVANMKMVFLNKNFRSVTGRDALSVSSLLVYDVQAYCSEMAANEEWDGDKHSIPECKELGEQYLTLDNGILSSSEAIYEKKGLKVQVRSTHAKSP